MQGNMKMDVPRSRESSPESARALKYTPGSCSNLCSAEPSPIHPPSIIDQLFVVDMRRERVHVRSEEIFVEIDRNHGDQYKLLDHERTMKTYRLELNSIAHRRLHEEAMKARNEVGLQSKGIVHRQLQADRGRGLAAEDVRPCRRNARFRWFSSMSLF